MMIVYLSPQTALWHWRERRLTERQTLLLAGFDTYAELAEAAEEELTDYLSADQEMTMTPEEREYEELRDAAWASCGEYLRECGSAENAKAEEARIIRHLIKDRRKSWPRFAGPATVQ